MHYLQLHLITVPLGLQSREAENPTEPVNSKCYLLLVDLWV